jgi:hypothetical protein
MTVRIEPANARHLVLFARELTPADDEEARLCGCANAFTAFSLLLAQSLEGWAAVLPSAQAPSDRVGAMLGVRPRTEGDGVQLWFHSTELFKVYPLAFMKPCRKLFDGLLERHPVVHGMIDPKNEAMIRLATWLGMELDAVQQRGPFQYHPAVARRRNHG